MKRTKTAAKNSKIRVLDTNLHVVCLGDDKSLGPFETLEEAQAALQAHEELEASLPDNPLTPSP